ncbi:MAG: DUF4430 domain-containing protein [Eubacteriales bacterium]|nr:DUF4430 domain-containing protein [Eubacteriales bacterium]
MKKNLKILLILLVCMIVFTGCSDNRGGSFESGSAINQDSSAESGTTIDQDAVTSSSAAYSAGSNSSGTMAQPVPDSARNAKQNAAADNKNVYYCTVLITCSTILDNMDEFDKAKLEVLPENGLVYQAEEVEFYEGDSVFDVLLRTTRDNGIHMEFVETPIYKSAYVEGINNIYEFDAGPLSGWMYKVNGRFPNYGSSRYQLKDGDIIEWIYTCDLGADIGGDWNAQNSKKDQ